MLSNSFVVFMIIIIIVLAIAIMLLANVLLGAAQIPRSKPADPEDEAPTYAGGLARSGSADAIPPGAVPPAVSMLFLVIPGISDTAFYIIVSIVLLEVIILLTLLYNVKLLLGIHKRRIDTPAEAAEAAINAKPKYTWWDKVNSFRPADQEQDIDLGHDYDGIRELDNRLPPWWLYGFYITIVFAGIYLWRFHVSHTAPSSSEEYAIAVQKAEVQKAEFLKKAANNVDETTVKLLTGEGDLASGKAIFESTCFACHGKAGEGGVGPNLTDEYWLHGGSINDIFKTIKYGWPEKGMKSWKDDLSPVKIAQIASYIKSIQGTHPANAKAPQGVPEK